MDSDSGSFKHSLDQKTIFRIGSSPGVKPAICKRTVSTMTIRRRRETLGDGGNRYPDTPSAQGDGENWRNHDVVHGMTAAGKVTGLPLGVGRQLDIDEIA